MDTTTTIQRVFPSLFKKHSVLAGGIILLLIAAFTPKPAYSQISYTDFDSPMVYDLVNAAPGDGIRFTQTTPWDPSDTDPFASTLTLLISPDYTDASEPNWSGWENMKWVSGTTPIPTPVATYGYTMDLPFGPSPQTITARTITLENVAWDVQNVLVRLRGADSVLSLENSSIDLQNSTSSSSPLFGNSATINSVAAAGTTNTISHLSGTVASAGVAVNVASGATLTFLNSGSLAQGALPEEQVYFSAGGNQFDVDAGTMNIESSSVRVEQRGTGSFRVRNNSRLVLNVSNSRLDVVQGNVEVENSTVTLNPNTEITIDGSLTTTDATVELIQGARLVAENITVSGDTVLTAFEQIIPSPLGGGVHSAGILLSGATDSLTVRGISEKRAGFYLENTGGSGAGLALSGGALNLEHARLAVNDIVATVNGGTVAIDALSDLQVTATGEFAKTSDLALANDGLIYIGGRFSGVGTITSTFTSGVTSGSFEVGPGGKVDILGNAGSSLVVQSGVKFDQDSEASLVLNPTLTSSQHMDVGGALTIDPTGSVLDLQLVDDAILPVGSKMMLFDYSDTNGLSGYFGNRPDGSIFDLGLNTYQIAYADPLWAAGTNSSVVTITVVPEPSGFLLSGAAALAGFRFWRRRKMA